MSEPLAHYSFIPWLRRGLANKIAETDALGANVTGAGYADERARLNVELVVGYDRISGGSDEDSVSKTVNLIGPGDIAGVNPVAVLRTEPAANVNNFEANLLAYIEFYEEDFPWRYTPVGPTGSKLRPWIALIVLKAGEFDLRDNGAGLPSFSVHPEAVNQVFCDHDETWAWAHVHLNQSLTGGTGLIGEVDNLLATDPDIGISRLLCPRKLQQSSDYTAFLIPAFETGRIAGLGKPTTGIKAQQPAWTKTGGQVTIAEVEGFNQHSFPFYYSWTFRTGKLGDFESLVAVLKPFPTDPESGKMPMDIQNPGYDLDGVAASQVIGFEGALKPPDYNSDPFPDGPGDQTFRTKLKKLLNLAVDAVENDNAVALNSAENPFYAAPFVEDPMIVPPIYGYWHAMIKKLGNAGNPSWIEKLNLDPRYRGAAGLGTKTVQAGQEDLMNRAWQQVGDVNLANQQIREAELAKMANRALFKKHLVNTSDDKFTRITGAAHSRVRNAEGSVTVNQEFKLSRVPAAVKSPAFTRITRPEKKSTRALNQAAAAGKGIHTDAVPNFNTGADAFTDPLVTAARLKQPGASAMSAGAVTAAIGSAKSNYLTQDIYLVRDLLFFSIETADLTTLNKSVIKSKIDLSTGEYETIRIADPVRWGSIKSQVESAIDQIKAYAKTAAQIEVKLEKDTYNTLFAGQEESDEPGSPPSGKLHNQVYIYRELATGEIERVGKATTLADIVQYEGLFAGFSAINADPAFVQPQLRLPIGDLNGVFSHIRSALDPETTLPAKVIRRIKVWKDGRFQSVTAMKPIMAYPKFEEPMYAELSKQSQNFILPNIEKLPRNSMTILETNRVFIESYMAGLNHEMARELLWREYPTDQRGSYFRQFWDASDNAFETDPEMTLDIKEMHKWQAPLGRNKPNPDAGNLVLVIRGDLLLKYPNTIIYAQKAAYDPSDPTLPRLLPDDISEENTLFPSFSAALKPDVFLFGFPLTTVEAEGERIYDSHAGTTGKNPGWFFVFRERPGQIKFGMDDYTDEFGNADVMPEGNPATWNDLAWEYLVASKADLDAYVIDLDAGIQIDDPPAGEPNPVWANNSADMASILYQHPVIFARHAAEML